MFKSLHNLGFVFFLLFAQQSFSQTVQPCADINTPEPAENCASACAACDFGTYTGSTAGFAADSTPIGFCSQIQNDQWIGFVALLETVTATITPSNCQGGNGVQFAIYGSCNSEPLACYAGCQGCGSMPATLSIPAIPGKVYFIVIDGFAQDECDFSLSIVPGGSLPPFPPTPNISGLSTLCPGGSTVYSIPPMVGAGYYKWNSSTPNVLFNGVSGPVVLEAPAGNSVVVTFPDNITGNITISVEPSNPCQTGILRSKTIHVQPVFTTNLPTIKVCYDGFPYILPWGDTAYVGGTHTDTLQNIYGCDSLISVFLQQLPPNITNLTRYVCQGDSVMICGLAYKTQGVFQAVCTSFQGCDSTVNLTLNVLNPIAQIIGPTVLNCASSVITLGSVSSPNFPGVSIKIWRNIAGNAISTGQILIVNQPGTYYLTTTINAGGLSCSQSDTVMVVFNGSGLTVSANDAILGCTPQSNTTLSASAEVGNMFTYAWSGPNQFTSTDTNPIVTETGVYSVTISNELGCVGSDSLTVSNPLPPLVAFPPATLTCVATTANLTATSPVAGVTFQWPPQLGNPPVATTPGSYIVTITDPQGCTSTGISVVTSDTTPPTIGLTSQSKCDGTVLLKATVTPPNTLLTWLGGFIIPNGNTAVVATSGTYLLAVSNLNNGCTASQSIVVAPSQFWIPLSANTTTTPSTGGQANGTATVTGSGGTSPYNYAWSQGGGPILGNTATIVNLLAGEYLCTITDNNGCSLVVSAMVGTSTTSEWTDAQVQWQIQPNPTSTGYFKVVASKPVAQAVQVEMYNALGQLVITRNIANPGIEITIDAAHLPAGTYQLALTGNKGERAILPVVIVR